MNAPVLGSRPCETVFGQRLDMVREARGWTISQLADHCRVSVRTALNWMGDDFEPLLAYAYKAACAVGYDVDDLADPAIVVLPAPRRDDAPGSLTLTFKGSVLTTKFGPALRTAILESGRTLRGFAAEIGVGRHCVELWTGTRTEPRLTSAMRAADQLGISLHGLCEGRIVERARVEAGDP